MQNLWLTKTSSPLLNRKQFQESPFNRLAYYVSTFSWANIYWTPKKTQKTDTTVSTWERSRVVTSLNRPLETPSATLTRATRNLDRNWHSIRFSATYSRLSALLGRSVLKRFSLHSSHSGNKGLNLAEAPAFQVATGARQVLFVPTLALREALRYYLLPSSFTSTEWV